MKLNNNMEKPKKPIQPNPSDKVKYPDPKTKEGKNYLGNPIYLSNMDYVRDCKKYQQDILKYEIELDLYEQKKLIRLIKNANEKLILKKYKIIHIDDIPKKINQNAGTTIHFK